MSKTIETKATEVVETQETAIVVNTNNGEVLETAPTPIDIGVDYVRDINVNETSYCTIIPKSREEKELLFNATNATQFKVKSFVNKTINVVGFYLETVTLQSTGERVPRTVLIDDKGNGYGSCSFGVFNGLKKIIKFFKDPITGNVDFPISITPIETPCDKGFALTLTVSK